MDEETWAEQYETVQGVKDDEVQRKREHNSRIKEARGKAEEYHAVNLLADALGNHLKADDATIAKKAKQVCEVYLNQLLTGKVEPKFWGPAMQVANGAMAIAKQLESREEADKPKDRAELMAGIVELKASAAELTKAAKEAKAAQ